MKILRHNHKWPQNRGTILCSESTSRDFNIIEAGTETGVKLKVKSLDLTFIVEISPSETDLLIRSLLKK